MSILPKNEPNEVDLTPRVFVFRGDAMSGKTYQAIRFPSPILINTDGNCKKVDTPSIYLNDAKYKTYKEKLETLFGALKELNETETPFKTIIIDLAEDIDEICVRYVLEKYNVKNLSDVKGYATGYIERKNNFNNIVSALKTLSSKYYIVFITHTVQKIIDDKIEIISMLKEDLYNNLTGQADLIVDCKKIGAITYQSKILKYRNNYKEQSVQEKCKDKSILDIIKDYQ